MCFNKPKPHVAIHKQKILGNINWFQRLLAPPQTGSIHLRTSFRLRGTPLCKNVIQMDESFKYIGNWQVILGNQWRIKHFTCYARQLINATSPEEMKNKCWWHHVVNSLSTQNSSVNFSTTQLYYYHFFNQHYKLQYHTACVLIKSSPRAQSGQAQQWELTNAVISCSWR